MRPKAYIETTVISYLTALPSRDLALAAHQHVTRDWWSTRRAFELYVSHVFAALLSHSRDIFGRPLIRTIVPLAGPSHFGTKEGQAKEQLHEV